MNICPIGKTQVVPCDGTATSERWCCGTSTDCCTTNKGVVTLEQVFEGNSSTTVSATSSQSSTPSGTSTSATSVETIASVEPRSHGLPGGVIAGIVISIVVGLAMLLATIVLARRSSSRRANTEGLLIAEASGMSQRHELNPLTRDNHVQELPGALPWELSGDTTRG